MFRRRWLTYKTYALQARVRELRLSVERKPSSLPSIQDALAGVMESDGSFKSEDANELPKLQRPPPVLDDNLWDEITTEVKRKSMHEPASLEEEEDEEEEDGEAAVEGTATEAASTLQEVQEKTSPVDSVDALANQIKAQIGTCVLCRVLCAASHQCYVPDKDLHAQPVLWQAVR